MYSTCLFCAAALGRNEAIESFPVGRRVAFDAWKGRLWAVCARCGRWNLAPIEERWEAVEAAEQLFVDTRTRVHSENIGLARLRDGTRLIRVGQALPGELAAWRYGSQLISRRRRHLLYTGLGVAAVGAAIAGVPLLISASAPFAGFQVLQASAQLYEHRRQRRVVHRVPAPRSPTGSEVLIQRRHLVDAALEPTASGDVGVRLTIPQLTRHGWKKPASGWVHANTPPLLIEGDEARRVLARALTDYNAKGAKEEEVRQALRSIEQAGGPEAFARRIAASRVGIGRAGARRRKPPAESVTLRQIAGTFRGDVLPVAKRRDLLGYVREGEGLLPKLDALALEMALNEEAERRALEGELAALEAAWREAEEIANIADKLPDLPPPEPPARV